MKKITKIIAATGIVAGLGVAGLPLVSYATGSSADDTVDVTLTVNDAISVAASNDVDLGDIAPGHSTVQGKTSTITITSNNVAGYTTAVTYVDLTDGTPEHNILAGTVSDHTASHFGISLSDGEYGSFATINGKNEESGMDMTNGDAYTIYFGAYATADQAAGNYTGSVTFTATNL